MSRLALERHQVWLYLAAIACGLMVGSVWPGVHTEFEFALWPVLAVLLYATFMQVPLLRVRAAFTDLRFLGAGLAGNFVLLPALLWGLLQFLPQDAPLRLGLLLVLLVPCTDWFISFTQLAGGDTSRAIAVTPLNLLLQLLLLPAYLWLMAPGDSAPVLGAKEMLPALLVVLVPLLAAAATELLLSRRAIGPVREGLGWLPIPALAVVLLLVAGAQVGEVGRSLHLLPPVVVFAAVFLILALLLAKAISVLLRLPVQQGRTLAFSFGTRNSFVVLPLALALPAGWEVAAAVIVIQSLVELLGMVVCLRIVPRWLFRE